MRIYSMTIKFENSGLLYDLENDHRKIDKEIIYNLPTRSRDQNQCISDLVQLVLSYEDYRSISAKKMAEFMCLSSRTLTRRLNNEGTSYRKLFLCSRINHAKRLLRTDAIRITEISRRLGYKDPSNFSKAFKKYTGTTPGKYRRNHLS